MMITGPWYWSRGAPRAASGTSTAGLLCAGLPRGRHRHPRARAGPRRRHASSRRRSGDAAAGRDLGGERGSGGVPRDGVARAHRRAGEQRRDRVHGPAGRAAGGGGAPRRGRELPGAGADGARRGGAW
jgi:hypothetical protein